MTVAVETRDLWKTFPGDIHAVRGVDMRIEPGELMVLVGASGCGKTTTLRMIAGLERVSSGEILVGDRMVNQVHPSKRGVALVFQNFALYPHKSARENIAFPLESQGMNKADIGKRIDEVARMLELSEHLDKRPGELSGGQQQRVSLGRAIVRNPNVLLLDEPLSNLDARLRVVMRTELKRIQRAVGSTAVYVTHDQVEAMTMGDRIVVMNGGIIEQIGTPPEVYLKPGSVAVARTIGSPAMNLLHGAPRQEGETLKVEGEGWALQFDGEGGDHLSRLLAERAGVSRLVLGVRPDDVDLAIGETDGASGQFGSGRCITAEPLGSEALYNVEIGNTLVRVLRRETHTSLAEDQVTRIMVRPGARLHVFDEASGARLTGLVRTPGADGGRWMPFDSAEKLTAEVS